MNKHDGGPAFPVVTRLVDIDPGGRFYQVETIGGTSLRDYFAGQALVGVLSAETHSAIPTNENLAAFVALNCYAYADAMLAARDVEGRTRDDRACDRQREDESV